MKVSLEVDLKPSETLRQAVLRQMGMRLSAEEIVHQLIESGTDPMRDLAQVMFQLAQTFKPHAPDTVVFDFRGSEPVVTISPALSLPKRPGSVTFVP